MSDKAGRIRPEGAPPNDEIAKTETSKIESGEYRRDESRKAHLHWGMTAAFWTILPLFLIAILIWAFHLLAPPCWQFLPPEQKDELGRLILVAVGSSTATTMAGRWVGPARRI